MTEYTDEELALALVKSGYSKELHYKELRHILSTLPAQPDEWERCTIHHIRHGEIFRARYHNGTVVEAEARNVGPKHISILKGRTLSTVDAAEIEQFYRIPAPITRPNPEQYPIILAYEWETDDGLVRNPFNSDLFEWSDQTNNYQGKWNVLTPEIITDWDPLEIASKEMTADD